MHMTNEEYQEFVKRLAPKSPVLGDVLKAFLVGGLICCGGQALLEAFTGPAGLSEDAAATWVSITLVLLSALLTGLNVYDKLARFAGAGTLVPITGFANALSSSYSSKNTQPRLQASKFIMEAETMGYTQAFEFEANEVFVELRFTEGTCLRIDRRGAEAGYVRTSRDRTAFDTLAYNDPFAYVQLMLRGDPHSWLKKRR